MEGTTIMGTSYSNITVRAEAGRIMGYLKYARHTAYVSSTANGFTVVCQEEVNPTGLAEELSQALRCVALSVLNDDDDAFSYDLWDGGKLLDQHASRRLRDDSAAGGIVAPDEWSPETDGQHRNETWDSEEEESGPVGDSRVVCRAFGCPAVVVAVKALLETTPNDDSTYVLSNQYHIALARLLSIPWFMDSFESLRDSPQGWTLVG